MNAISGWLQNSKLGEQKDQALRTLDHMGAAFLSMAAEKAKDFLDSALPGFKQHLQQQEGGQHGQQGQGQHQGSQSGPTSGQGASYYGERGRSGGDWSRGSQSTPGSSQGSGSNWSTDPAHQGSYTNQGGQQSGWSGSNPAQQGSQTQQGTQGGTAWSGGHQEGQERSRTNKEQTGSVQQDASSSSYNKP